jgi:hypothetical protein
MISFFRFTRGYPNGVPMRITTRLIDVMSKIPFLLYGVLSFTLGLAMYFTGVLLVFPRYLLGLNTVLLPTNEWLVWYSGVPIMIGFLLASADVLLFLRLKRTLKDVRFDTVNKTSITVALTAYNDEASIAQAVKDFVGHPRVARVLVVSNNSGDNTLKVAKQAGALTFNEEALGYGHCVYRCLEEASRFADSELIVLCEGDLTFRAYDIDKLVEFAPHADVVNGTRTVERLRQYKTQLSTFIYYGNFFVGKLLEAKHVGRSTITDVGTTYKLCRRQALLNLLPCLNRSINLEFNAHFLDQVLTTGLALVECPVTFHQRVGESKGGNKNDFRALWVGIQMIRGIVFGWNTLK